MQSVLFENACRIHLWSISARYLMANADGRWDGFEKAVRHRELCQFYVAVHRGWVEPDSIPVDDPDFLAVHSATQQLTDRLDEALGFPLKGTPDYELFVPRFLDQFHGLAMSTLGRLSEKN